MALLQWTPQPTATGPAGGSIACGSEAYGLPPAYGCGRGSGIKPMAEPRDMRNPFP